jgi:GR25 family glycosyltransferase involved in LPS biosynthesis
VRDYITFYDMIRYCYYINLKERLDRKVYIENQLKNTQHLKNIYKRFEAIDGSYTHPRYLKHNILTENAISDILSDEVVSWGLTLTQGALGVLLTYIELFNIIKNLDSEVIVFEDDVQLDLNFDNYLEKILSELPNNFDICYLGYGEDAVEKVKYSDNLFIPKGVLTCLPSIIISPKGAENILNILKDVNYQIDTVIYNNFKSLEVFASEKKMVKIENTFKSDIQGNINCKKNYKKQNYIFSTLAVGYSANVNALKLVSDLNYFKQNILVITDDFKLYEGWDNVVIIKYPNKKFSFNDKMLCFEEGFKLEDCVIYIDSDTRIFYENYKNCYTNFFRIISPGFHPSWDWGKIERKDSGFFSSTDIVDRVHGYGELALKLCNILDITTSDSYHFQEGLLILCKDSGKEIIFLDIWKKLATVLDDYESRNNSFRIGAGEGNLIGLAISKSGLKLNSVDLANLIGCDLKYNFHNPEQSLEYIKNFPNRKLTKLDTQMLVRSRNYDVVFKNYIIDLHYEIYQSTANIFVLYFDWNTKNTVEFLDHEFKVNDNIYHFNSEKKNEFTFIKSSNVQIYHTYDWYGEKDWNLIDEI